MNNGIHVPFILLYTYILILSFAVQMHLSLIRYNVFTFFFYFHYSRRWVIEDVALIYVLECSAYVFLYRENYKEFYSFWSYI